MVSSLDNVPAPLVLDASVAINIAAAAPREAILRAIPNELLITDVVMDELRNGAKRGRDDLRKIEELIESREIRVTTLPEEAEEVFQSLVFGSTVETLDDGEAATLAYCAMSASVALTDDGKAVQLAKKRFPTMLVAHSIDVFAHRQTICAFEREALADIVFTVFQNGRMRVFPQHVQWVKSLLGPTRCALCNSLPLLVRTHSGTKGI